MKNYIKSVVALTVICSVIAVLLAITNSITAPIVEESIKRDTQKALAEVLPDGKNFEAIDYGSENLSPTIIEAYSEDNGGYVFKLQTKGYASGLTIMCGINKDGMLVGAKCIASNETNGAEVNYGENFKNKNYDNASQVDTVAGSTLTTKAYKNAIMDAISAFQILSNTKGDS